MDVQHKPGATGTAPGLNSRPVTTNHKTKESGKMKVKDITVSDALSLLCNSDRAIIVESTEQGQQIVIKGWVADVKKNANEELLSRKAEALRCICETRHRKWKEKGLIAPIMPEQTPEYSFKDMEVRVYYAIHI